MVENVRQNENLGRDAQNMVRGVVGNNLKTGRLEKICSMDRGILVSYADGTYGYRTNLKSSEVKIHAQEEGNPEKTAKNGLNTSDVLKITEALYEPMTILEKKGSLTLKNVYIVSEDDAKSEIKQPGVIDEQSISINLNSVDLSNEKGKNDIRNAVYKQAVRNICTSSVKMSEMGWKIHEVYENIDDNRVEVHTNDYLEDLARTIEPEIKEKQNTETEIEGIINEIKECSQGDDNIISQYGTLYYKNPKGLKEFRPHYHAALEYLSKRHSRHSAPMIKRLEVRPVCAVN